MKTVIAMTALLLGGCMVSKPIAIESAIPIPASRIFDQLLTTPAEGRGLVTVVRDAKHIRGAMECDYFIHVDGKRTAALRASQKVDLYLEPGSHVIGVHHPDTGICKYGQIVQVAVLAEPNQPVKLRAGYNENVVILEPTAY